MAIVSEDSLQSWPVDDVANFTRTPHIWMYAQSHYRTDEVLEPGVVALQRDDQRGALVKADQRSLTVRSQSPVVQLDKEIKFAEDLSWPQNADFLRLRLTLRYPLWWSLAKPSQISIIVHRADGSREAFKVIVEPNRSCEVWIFPWDKHQLMNYFSPRWRGWRVGQRSPLVDVGVIVHRMDWFSVAPSQIDLQELDAVTLSATMN